MELDHCGRIIRKLMINHNKSRPTTKIEIREDLSLPAKDIPKILSMTQEYLKNFDIEMVGVNGTNVGSVTNCEKIFLRKTSFEETKKLKREITREDKQMMIIFSMIQIENNHLSSNKIDIIKKCKYFVGTNIDELFKKLKAMGYITNTPLIDDNIWSFSWRYFAEFEDSFDVVNYFEEQL